MRTKCNAQEREKKASTRKTKVNSNLDGGKLTSHRAYDIFAATARQTALAHAEEADLFPVSAAAICSRPTVQQCRDALGELHGSPQARTEGGRARATTAKLLSWCIGGPQGGAAMGDVCCGCG